MLLMSPTNWLNISLEERVTDKLWVRNVLFLYLNDKRLSVNAKYFIRLQNFGRNYIVYERKEPLTD